MTKACLSTEARNTSRLSPAEVLAPPSWALSIVKAVGKLPAQCGASLVQKLATTTVFQPHNAHLGINLGR